MSFQRVMNEKHEHIIEEYTISETPPPPPVKPKVLTREWVSSMKPRRPLLPPALQLRFPFNLVLYTLLPILIPTFLSIAVVRLSLASRDSRARIKLLEKEGSGGSQQRLIHVLAELENDMENAVAELVDGDDPGIITPSRMPIIKAHEHPILTPLQRKIIVWLNTLPELKKERAFFPNLRNAHAMIISRDVKRFEAHREGEDVIRHWANHLVL